MKRDLIDLNEIFCAPVREKPAVEARCRRTYRRGLDTALFGTLVLAYCLGGVWFACAVLLA